MSINQEFARSSDVLKTGDEVALLPPVSGGSDATARSPHCAIVRDPIETAAIPNSLKRPENGAPASSQGTVRNHTRDLQTLYLAYTPDEALASQKMADLAK